MAKERLRACRADEVPEGAAKIVGLSGRSIGIYRVDGGYYALLNRCPHRGAALCEGPVSGTTIGAGERDFTYGRQGEILRCSWHGWEFDIRTGIALVDPTTRARSFTVEVEGDELYVIV